MTPSNLADVSQAYRNVRVVVLGAGGFIGRRISAALAGVGASATLVVRPEKGTHDSVVRSASRIAFCDLERPTDVSALIRDIQPDVIFSLAAYGVDPRQQSTDIAARINHVLVSVVAEALAADTRSTWPGVRLIHTGSALEYGRARGGLNEDTPCEATTMYGRSKLAGTEALATECRRSGLRGVTARLFTVYGPGERPRRLLPTLLHAAESTAAIELTDGDQRRDFTFVDDVVEGLLRLGVADVPPGAAVNLATGKLTSVRSFVETAAQQLGIHSDRLAFGARPTRAGEMCHDEVDVSLLIRLIGWKPATTIQEGISLTAQEIGRGLNRRPAMASC